MTVVASPRFDDTIMLARDTVANETSPRKIQI